MTRNITSSEEWLAYLSCGSPLLEQRGARNLLHSCQHANEILWDKLQSVLEVCLQSKSTVVIQQVVLFIKEFWLQDKAPVVTEKWLHWTEKYAEPYKQYMPWIWFDQLFEMIVALESCSTREFYFIRLLSNTTIQEEICFVIYQAFIRSSITIETKVKWLQMLQVPIETIIQENSENNKIVHFISSLYSYLMTQHATMLPKEQLLLNALHWITTGRTTLSIFEKLNILQPLWQMSSKDIQLRGYLIQFLLAVSFQDQSLLLLSVWNHFHSATEKNMWQQTISYCIGWNYWRTILLYLVYGLIQQGEEFVAFQLQQLWQLSPNDDNEEIVWSTSLHFMHVLLTVLEYQQASIPWIENLWHTYDSWQMYASFSHHHGGIQKNHMPLEKLYEHFSYNVFHFDMLCQCPEWMACLDMLSDFLTIETASELFPNKLWTWYRSMHPQKKHLMTIRMWFAVAFAYVYQQSNSPNLGNILYYLNQVHDEEKLEFLPILFCWKVSFIRSSHCIDWIQSWLKSCPHPSCHAILIYQWMHSLLSVCKKRMKLHQDTTHIYTMLVSFMIKEAVFRGDPWKNQVLKEIATCCRMVSTPNQMNDLCRIGYSWMEYLVQKRPTWIVHFLFSHLQQPFASLPSVGNTQEIAILGSCISIVQQLCDVGLLDPMKSLETLYEWYVSSHFADDLRALEVTWMQFLKTVSFEQLDIEKTTMKAHRNIYIFSWLSEKLLSCAWEDHHYLKHCMETWLKWLEIALSIQSSAMLSPEKYLIDSILEPSKWWNWLHQYFEKYFSVASTKWLSIPDGQDTLAILLKGMIKAVGLEWKYRKRLEWSKLERHEIRNWSFSDICLEEWQLELSKMEKELPQGIIRLCIHFLLELCIHCLIHQTQYSQPFKGFYAVWILCSSGIMPFHEIVWQKWISLLQQQWPQWIDSLQKYQWTLQECMFWLSFWNFTSIQKCPMITQWLVYQWVQETSVAKMVDKEDVVSIGCFYMLWNTLIGYPPIELSPSLCSYQRKYGSLETMERQLEQCRISWWKKLMDLMDHWIEQSPSYAMLLGMCCDWIELQYQAGGYQSDKEEHVILEWITRQQYYLIQPYHQSAIRMSLLRRMACWSKNIGHWQSLGNNHNEKRPVEMAYDWMHLGLYPWKKAFGIEFIQAWINQSTQLAFIWQETFIQLLHHYPLSLENMQQMIEIWLEYIFSRYSTLENDQQLDRLFHFLYHCWFYSHLSPSNEASIRHGQQLVQMICWYQQLMTPETHNNIMKWKTLLHRWLINFSEQLFSSVQQDIPPEFPY